MKEPAWLPAARALAYGSKRKITCTDCQSPSTLMVSHKAAGYGAYCFRGSCGLKEFHPHGVLSLAQLAKRRADTEALQTSRDFSLPQDCTEHLSASARLWLLKAGISESLRQAYGIMYSSKLSRVVIPVSTGGFLARSVDGTSPKYVLKTDLQSTPIFISKSELELKEKPDTEIDLVICEDVLSAIRVGRLVRSCAILGTAFGDALVNAVMQYAGKEHPVIGVWTDSDKAGMLSRNRIRSSLRLQGATVVDIRTPKDPKFYSNREIRECLAIRSQL